MNENIINWKEALLVAILGFIVGFIVGICAYGLIESDHESKILVYYDNECVDAPSEENGSKLTVCAWKTYQKIGEEICGFRSNETASQEVIDCLYNNGTGITYDQIKNR